MIARFAGRPPIELEVFGTSLGASLVAGGLSLLAPFLVALTGTLAALAFAGWCSLLRRRGGPASEIGHAGPSAALAVLAVASALYLEPPPPFSPFRGVTLAAALLPLWAVERSRRVSGARAGATAP